MSHIVKCIYVYYSTELFNVLALWMFSPNKDINKNMFSVVILKEHHIEGSASDMLVCCGDSERASY